MAVIEYDEYKQKLLALEPALGELEKALGIPKAREEYDALQKETEQDGFWNDLARSQKVSQQIRSTTSSTVSFSLSATSASQSVISISVQKLQRPVLISQLQHLLLTV